MNWKHWASLVVSTLVGAAAGYVQAHLATDGIPSTNAKIKSLAVGAGVAGLVAVANLLRQAPGAPQS